MNVEELIAALRELTEADATVGGWVVGVEQAAYDEHGDEFDDSVFESVVHVERHSGSPAGPYVELVLR